MSLQNLLDLSTSREKAKNTDVTEERLRACLPAVRNLIAFYREYPDLLVDSLKGEDSTFKFRLSQRVFLRAIMRHRYVYSVFPRGFSKSFLAVMALMLKAILFPNSQLFVTTGGKEQAASITIAKVEEICRLLPCLSNEIDWSRGVTRKTKDDVRYTFKNHSYIDILAARESTRGQRRTGGVIEEAILVDGTVLNEIIIPTTNIDRRLPDGTYDRDEVVNQSQVYITTAGWKNSFPYDKLIEIFINSILFPDKYMILGGDYELAIIEGAVKEDMVDQMRLNGTYNESSFEREYGSVWSGDAENAYFSGDTFEKYRTLRQAESEWSGRSARNAYYVLGVDVGRFGCTTEVMVIKVTPQVQGAAQKTLVNLFTYDAEHFEIQAIHIKKLFNLYKCRKAVIDGNGLGAGLTDFMVKSQVDPETGEYFPPFGIDNDIEGIYKKYRTVDTVRDAVYIVKANAPINSEAHTYLQTQLGSGKIHFLIDEKEAKAKLMETKVGQNMSPEQRNEYLRPYQLTTILKDQMLNLVEESDGINVILKQNSRGIKKDKFSALEYGLYYIKQEESKKHKHVNGMDLSKLMLMS